MTKLTDPQLAFLTSIANGSIERSSLSVIGNTLNKKGLCNYSYPERRWHITQAGIEQIKGDKA